MYIYIYIYMMMMMIKWWINQRVIYAYGMTSKFDEWATCSFSHYINGCKCMTYVRLQRGYGRCLKTQLHYHWFSKLMDVRKFWRGSWKDCGDCCYCGALSMDFSPKVLTIGRMLSIQNSHVTYILSTHQMFLFKFRISIIMVKYLPGEFVC